MSSNVIEARQLDFEQIKEIIPQRFPFLMLDRVVDIEPGVYVVGIKNLTGNEWFYQGHFPGKAITPGAMISEAIAQTGIIFFHTARPTLRDVTYLLASFRVRFLSPVWPGDQMRIKVVPIRLMQGSGILSAEVSVDGRQVVKGQFGLIAKPNREL